jgi:hypothetical protein
MFKLTVIIINEHSFFFNKPSLIIFWNDAFFSIIRIYFADDLKSCISKISWGIWIPKKDSRYNILVPNNNINI